MSLYHHLTLYVKMDMRGCCHLHFQTFITQFFNPLQSNESKFLINSFHRTAVNVNMRMNKLIHILRTATPGPALIPNWVWQWVWPAPFLQETTAPCSQMEGKEMEVFEAINRVFNSILEWISCFIHKNGIAHRQWTSPTLKPGDHQNSQWILSPQHLRL